MPAELKVLPRWVTWRFKHGKKVPYISTQADTCADSTNPATWGTFEQAEIAFLFNDYSGIGFVLNNDGLVGVDLDKCYLDGTPDPRAIAILDELQAAYIEVSPSGKGLRAFGYGPKLDKGHAGIHNDIKIELYSSARYLTLTGHAIRSGPLKPLHGFAELAASLKKKPKAEGDGARAEWVQEIVSGTVFHNSLLVGSSSLVRKGFSAATTVSILESLMDACTAPHDDHWAMRRAEIPGLVESAYVKFVLPDPDATRYKVLTAADLRALPAIEWLVKGILPTQGIGAAFGPSGSGKSFLIFGMCAAIAEGGEWFGLRVKARPVVYVGLEGEAGFKQRAEAWETVNGRPLPFGVVLQPFRLLEAQDIADLAAVVPAGGVIVIDTLAQAATGTDENSFQDMSKIVAGAQALQRKGGGFVCLIHHTGKDTTKGLRGHSSLIGALDVALEVTRDGNTRAWAASKTKDAQSGQVFGFRLDVVPLGIDEDGDAITSCIVQPVAVVARPKGLTPRQQSGLDALRRVADGSGAHRNAWRASFYLACGIEDHDTRRKAFARLVEDLTAAKIVSANGDWFTL